MYSKPVLYINNQLCLPLFVILLIENFVLFFQEINSDLETLGLIHPRGVKKRVAKFWGE